MKTIGLKSISSHSEESWNPSETECGLHRRYHDSECGSCSDASLKVRSRKWSVRRRVLFVVVCILSAAIVSVFLWLLLAFTIPHHNTPHISTNAINSIIDNWSTPSNSTNLLSPWPANFTTGILPLQCHSHNDYNRAVPLFQAIAAGCSSIEADIHIPATEGGVCQVGHSRKSLRAERTLQSMYIKPLLTILSNINSQTGNSTNSSWRGIFEASQDTTLVLLLDFKGDGVALWPYVNRELQSLREKGWLTRWDTSAGVTRGPVTVVATGNAPFGLLISNTTYRDIFYDAPLDDIANTRYDATNSYYASVSMSKTIGRQWLWKFSSSQLNKISAQISAAKNKGLVSRYWETPAWPVTFRNYVAGILIESGIGVLNIDDFDSRLYFPLRTRFSTNRLTWYM